MLKKIVIAGGNGFLGRTLISYFNNKAEKIVVLSRKPFSGSGKAIVEIWNADSPGEWTHQLEGADVLINLCGKNVNCRYTTKNRKAIYESRIKPTQLLAEAVRGCAIPPKLWINSSSATIYKASFDKLMTEAHGETGDDFSMDVCKTWEREFNNCQLSSTRKIIFRTGIVLGNGGGALPPMRTLAKLGFGMQGNGDQYCSWVHELDFCRAVEHVIDNRHAEGIYNICVPTPVRNKKFMELLHRVINVRVSIPLPGWILEAGAFLIRTETELVLKSRKVFPKRLLDEGFVFEFHDAKSAFEELCRKEARIRHDSILSH